MQVVKPIRRLSQFASRIHLFPILCAGLALVLFAAEPLILAPMQANATSSPDSIKSTIQINLNKPEGQINPKALGLTINILGNDIPELQYFFRSAEGKQKLNEIGFGTINLTADRNNWSSPYSTYTAAPEVYPSVMDTSEFLSLSKSMNADPMITINITHQCHQEDSNLPPSSANVVCTNVTPKLAQAWLKNIKQLGIRQVNYVQLGAEPYAGCWYWIDSKGLDCTVDNTGEHKIALSEQDYAKRVIKWSVALKKIVPGIKVGLHLQPNTFICKGSCSGMEWDRYLLTKAGKYVDFLITHQYYVLMQPVVDEVTAQKYSYYQEQLDVRVVKQGVTATPTQIRKELIKWLPTKKNMPIVIGEYNAGQLWSDDSPETKLDNRMSLFTGFSVAETALDLLSPVKSGSTMLPGAERVLLLDLQSYPTTIAHYLPFEDPQTIVYSPAWYMLAALQGVQGKTFINTAVNNNPQTLTGRGALRVYTVKKGKNVLIAVFNHDSAQPITADLLLNGGNAKSASMTRIGDTALSFLAMNSAINPTAIAPVTSTILQSQIQAKGIIGMVFPAHSLSVLHVTLE